MFFDKEPVIANLSWVCYPLNLSAFQLFWDSCAVCVLKSPYTLRSADRLHAAHNSLRFPPLRSASPGELSSFNSNLEDETFKHKDQITSQKSARARRAQRVKEKYIFSQSSRGTRRNEIKKELHRLLERFRFPPLRSPSPGDTDKQRPDRFFEIIMVIHQK